MNDLERIVQLFRAKRSFLLFLHMIPDGDGVGSTLALSKGLKKLGKEVTIAKYDPVPEQYRFLPGWDEFVDWPDVQVNHEVIVFLDCTDPERAGLNRKSLGESATVVNIDHHVSNKMFGDLNYVDTEASAVGEQVLALLEKLGAEIDSDMATCLYTAVMTDSGSFRYENTTARTHLAAARLVEMGARPYDISLHVYESKSFEGIKLLSEVLAGLQLSPTGKVSWLKVTGEMLRRTGASESETEGLVNYARGIRGVEIGILFREYKQGSIKVALRSRNHVDVSALASRFNGGGHARAAGCLITGSMAEVERLVLQEAFKEVGESWDTGGRDIECAQAGGDELA